MTPIPSDLSAAANGGEPITMVMAPPRYMASVGYYAAMWAFHSVCYDSHARYDKRCKEVHRATIADTQGELRLTVPVNREEAPAGTRPTWAHRMVSAHGHWWEIQRTALESAYGRTPYFQYYYDLLLQPLSRESVGRSIVDLDMDVDRAIRKMLHHPTEVTMPQDADPGLRSGARKIWLTDLVIPETPPYWQVRASRHGFLGGLSVLDMIFNIGPESQILLRDMAEQIKHLNQWNDIPTKLFS